MMAIDFAKVGLKCGLEIHQQLSTRKLFCHCPSRICDDKPDVVVERFLRASAGETGVVDAAATAEASKAKRFVYQGYRDTSCLVEFDEEPPHPLCEDALYVTLQVAELLGSDIVPNVRVMRKTVIDGSNTSGFQRTALVALGGSLEGVGVETVCLEEDSAKIVSRDAGRDVYNLSRLGIPLIEIATAPDIHSPQQARDVAAALGMVLRSTGRVRRGLGSIRQDLNVSIKGGVRVEIKGVQDLRLVPTLVEYEVLRQLSVLSLIDDRGSAKVECGDITDITGVFKDADARIVNSALKKGGVVLGVRLSGMAGFLGRELQPGRRLGSELADYAKSRGVKGLFHCDELPGYGITVAQVVRVKKALGVKKGDGFVLIADGSVRARSALEAVVVRIADLSLRKEVRQALPEGASAFLRPMPGAARMYPETDIPAVVPDSSAVEVPELISEKAVRFASQYGISADLAGQLSREGFPFDDWCARFLKVPPSLVAEMFLATPKELKKRFGLEVDDRFEGFALDVLSRLDKGEIGAQAVVDILARLVKGEEVDYALFRPLDAVAIDAAVEKAIAADPNAPIGALMGSVMKVLRGRADGKAVMRHLKKRLG